MRHTLALALIGGLPSFAAADQPALRIGEECPPVDLEHVLHAPDASPFGGAVVPGDGTIYVIDFWATWCAPCIAGFPELSDMQERFAEEDVVVVSVSDEPRTLVDRFLDRNALKSDRSWRRTLSQVVAADPDGSTHQDLLEAAAEYVLPTVMIIGRDGRLLWIGNPGVDDPVAALEAIVEGTWDWRPFRDSYTATEGKSEDLKALLEARRWDDAAARFAGDWESLNQIAFAITLQPAEARSDEEIALARRLADRALELSDGAEAFPLHVRASIHWLDGQRDEAVRLQRRAVKLGAGTSWEGFYQGALDRYEEAGAASKGD